MGLRSYLQSNRHLTVISSIAVVVLSLGYAAWTLHANRPQGMYRGLEFYSDDYGKTWFSDSAGKVVPFDHDGKTAYSAVVMQCDACGAKYVVMLRRFSPAVAARLQKAVDVLKVDPKNMDSSMAANGIRENEFEVALPSDHPSWRPKSEFSAIIHSARCPVDGKLGSTLMP